MSRLSGYERDMLHAASSRWNAEDRRRVVVCSYGDPHGLGGVEVYGPFRTKEAAELFAERTRQEGGFRLVRVAYVRSAQYLSSRNKPKLSRGGPS